MTEYKIETLEHLGLVSSMIDELGIVDGIHLFQRICLDLNRKNAQ